MEHSKRTGIFGYGYDYHYVFAHPGQHYAELWSWTAVWTACIHLGGSRHSARAGMGDVKIRMADGFVSRTTRIWRENRAD